MKILAIETSHDDTSVALYQDRKIIKEISITQTEFHKQFGGTLPEYAARHHEKSLGIILEQFLSKFNLTDIDHVAYTKLPGLVGSLHMGSLFAHAIGYSLGKEVFPINHMHGHIFASAFEHDIKFPAIALIVSGGHTQLWNVKSTTNISLISQTRDDAAGEVFDKVSRRLGLGFPGGPAIEKASIEAEVNIDFNLHDELGLEFSFSGLKTKVLNYINNNKGANANNIAASFQDAIVNNLITKAQKAIDLYKPNSIILGGGVAANSLLRERFAKLSTNALIPSKKYTTDNASMIAITSAILHNEKW